MAVKRIAAWWLRWKLWQVQNKLAIRNCRRFLKKGRWKKWNLDWTGAIAMIVMRRELTAKIVSETADGGGKIASHLLIWDHNRLTKDTADCCFFRETDPNGVLLRIWATSSWPTIVSLIELLFLESHILNTPHRLLNLEGHHVWTPYIQWLHHIERRKEQGSKRRKTESLQSFFNFCVWVRSNYSGVAMQLKQRSKQVSDRRMERNLRIGDASSRNGAATARGNKVIKLLGFFIIYLFFSILEFLKKKAFRP